MKKTVFVGVYLVSAFYVFGLDVNLDVAINESAVYLMSHLPQRARIAVTNFGTETYGSRANTMSEYIIDDTIKYLVDNGFSVVDRQNIDMARKELNFNMSGEVSDETAQKIGRFLGAQVVVFGYIKPMGNTVRFKVCAITVETAEILGVYMENIKKGDITGIFGKEPEPPEPPKPSIDIGPEVNLGLGFSVWNGVAIKVDILDLQLGVNINDSFLVLLDAGIGGGLAFIFPFSYYYIGGLLEKRLFEFLSISVGGGIESIGLLGSKGTYASYIRGAVAVLPDGDSVKLELYYDYGIDSGYKLGIKYIIRFMELY